MIENIRFRNILITIALINYCFRDEGIEMKKRNIGKYFICKKLKLILIRLISRKMVV